MNDRLLGPVAPGEILCDDFMKPMGITVSRLARDIAVPSDRISGIVSGRRGITADTALRLERYFGVEAQFWLNLQSEYDLRIMKRKIGTDIEQQITPLQREIQQMTA